MEFFDKIEIDSEWIKEEQKENHFMRWFMKNYKPDKNKDGWYIDKVCRGASATVEGARSQHAIIYELIKDLPI